MRLQKLEDENKNLRGELNDLRPKKKEKIVVPNDVRVCLYQNFTYLYCAKLGSFLLSILQQAFLIESKSLFSHL